MAEWFLDTGGEFHCTNNRGLLHDTQVNEHRRVKLPDGTVVPMHERGSVRTELFKIPDVYYAPGMQMNIISVYKLHHDHGLAAVFGRNRCDFKDDTSGLIVGSASLRRGRYVLDYLLIGQDVDASLLAKLSKGGLSQPHPEEPSWYNSESVQTGRFGWVLDTCDRGHHTSNPQLLVDDGGIFEPVKDKPLRTDDVFSFSGRWSLRSERFKVPHVKYNNEALYSKTGVISVRSLARDHELVTVFEPTCCYVKDKNGQIVGEGRLRNGTYVLDYLRISQAQDASRPQRTRSSLPRPLFGFSPNDTYELDYLRLEQDVVNASLPPYYAIFSSTFITELIKRSFAICIC